MKTLTKSLTAFGDSSLSTDSETTSGSGSELIARGSQIDFTSTLISQMNNSGVFGITLKDLVNI